MTPASNKSRKNARLCTEVCRAERRENMKSGFQFSKLVALGVLAVDGYATYRVLGFCDASISAGFLGSMPYLTTMIGALQAATAVVLNAYFFKARAENTKGGITYDAAIGRARDCDSV